MIQWHEVTWYSRWGAIILFLIVVPVLCFYIGVQYEAVQQSYSSADTQKVPMIQSTAIQSDCNAILKTLSDASDLPVVCSFDVGHGVSATFSIATTGIISIGVDDKTPLTLKPYVDYNPDNEGVLPLRVKFEDINFDGYVDFEVDDVWAGINGINTFYDYNPTKGVYEYATLVPDELTDGTFDSNAQTISFSSNEGYAGDFYHSWTYHWQNGAYVLVSRITQGGDVCTGITRTTEELQNGKMVVTKTEPLGPDETFCKTK